MLSALAPGDRERARAALLAVPEPATPCRVCGEASMEPVIWLGDQPLANEYPTDPDAFLEQHPLLLTRCPGAGCGHTQLDHTVDPQTLFGGDYAYASGTSATMRAHFRWLAAEVEADLVREGWGGGTRPVVLDIACNDGAQLDAFAERGWQTIGVDPAPNVVAMARRKGHHVVRAFWGPRVAELLATRRPADAIVAQNVVAHVPDPVAFLRACAAAMRGAAAGKSGNDALGPAAASPAAASPAAASPRLYVQTSQYHMYDRGEFDTIYHEHASFFTVSSMARAAAEAGLVVERVRFPPAHGGSLLVRMALPGAAAPDSSVADALAAEDLSPARYERYRDEVFGRGAWVRAAAALAAGLGRAAAGAAAADDPPRPAPLVAYGAAAKGMTALAHWDLAPEYVVDDSPLKQGRFTPPALGPERRRVPIVGPDRLADDTRPDLVVLVLAWNMWDEIRTRVLAARPGTRTWLLRAYPTPALERLGV